LTGAGFDVAWVKDGESALSTLALETFLAMVLDLGLPGVGGLDILRTLRSRGDKIPVLILTARDATLDKVIGFNHGADDFLSKATDVEELIARLHALIRRSDRGEKYVTGDLVLDLGSGKVTQKGAPIDLSKREFDVLRILMQGAKSVVTRNQLQQALYGNDRPMESNAIDVHIHNLRAKLGPKTLKTIRGVGYTIGL
jgi:two-component system OmpR family response regulator/two-component system response regulator QseB